MQNKKLESEGKKIGMGIEEMITFAGQKMRSKVRAKIRREAAETFKTVLI